jgi:hypothetical protein
MKLKSFKSWWDDQLDKMTSIRQPYREKSKVILYDFGFELIDADGNPYPVMWSKVGCINAYKVDLFSVDLIWVINHLTHKA